MKKVFFNKHHLPVFLIISLVLISIAVFSYSIYILLDPDFGWHLEMGKLILKSGIPKTDPFSYTMPSFPYIDHEWASNILLYFLYSQIGKLGLAIIYSILTILSLLIAVPKKLFQYSLIPLIFSVILFSHFVNIRPQNETWVLFSILIVVLFDTKLWQRFKFFLPIIFLIWANLHAGFALGLAVLGFSVLFDFLKTKTISKTNLGIVVASTLATLVNPYGTRLYEEVFRSMFDSSLRSSVQEWVPLYYQYDLTMIFILAFSFVFIYKFWKDVPLKEKWLYIILFLLSVSSYRHLPFFIILNLRLLTFGIYKFFQTVRKNSSLRVQSAKVISVLLSFELLLFTFTSTTKQAQELSENAYYPKAAVTFLNNHPLIGRIFSSYNWGGYLIWKLPEKKDFVDGRMPSWKQDNPPPGESSEAFKEYQDAIYAGKLKQVLAKYNVTLVLWPKTSKNLNSTPLSISAFLNSLLPYSTSSDQSFRLGSDWKIIYQDKVAIIYQKIKP